MSHKFISEIMHETVLTGQISYADFKICKQRPNLQEKNVLNWINQQDKSDTFLCEVKMAVSQDISVNI